MRLGTTFINGGHIEVALGMGKALELSAKKCSTEASATLVALCLGAAMPASEARRGSVLNILPISPPRSRFRSRNRQWLPNNAKIHLRTPLQTTGNKQNAVFLYGFEPVGREFESLRAHHKTNQLEVIESTLQERGSRRMASRGQTRGCQSRFSICAS